MKDSQMTTNALILLCYLLAASLIVNAYLIYINKRTTCGCCKGNGSFSYINAQYQQHFVKPVQESWFVDVDTYFIKTENSTETCKLSCSTFNLKPLFFCFNAAAVVVEANAATAIADPQRQQVCFKELVPKMYWCVNINICLSLHLYMFLHREMRTH